MADDVREVTSAYHAHGDTELTLAPGDYVTILEGDSPAHEGWAFGKVGDREGWFPASSTCMPASALPLAATAYSPPPHRPQGEVPERGAGWSATKTAKLAEKKCAVSAIRRLDGKRGGGAGSIEHARRAPPTPPHTTERAAAASIVPRPDASPIALRAGFRSGERPDSMSHEPTALLARVRDRHGATLAARGGSELARAVSGREYRDR